MKEMGEEGEGRETDLEGTGVPKEPKVKWRRTCDESFLHFPCLFFPSLPLSILRQTGLVFIFLSLSRSFTSVDALSIVLFSIIASAPFRLVPFGSR